MKDSSKDLRSVSIEPWLSVIDATQAISFYRSAFGAIELERLEAEPGQVIVAQLAIGGSSFWIQQDEASSPLGLAGRLSVRMILVIDDPDSLFAQAVAAGAGEVVPMGDANGWRVGRISDPSGHHWEIGRRLLL